MFASHSNDKERTEEALSLARAASPLELYLFLQAFIHSAPHAIVNILDLMWRFSNPSFDKGKRNENTLYSSHITYTAFISVPEKFIYILVRYNTFFYICQVHYKQSASLCRV